MLSILVVLKIGYFACKARAPIYDDLCLCFPTEKDFKHS